MNYIDLTHTIVNAMPTHPYDVALGFPTQLKAIATYQEHGVSNHALSGSVHMGTHIDAPSHFTDSDKKITDFTLDTFIGQAVCIDARNQKIINKDLLTHVPLHKNLIVLFCTEWDARFYEPNYFSQHPTISLECAHYLVDAGVKMVGVDFPSVDQAPFAVHKLLLSNDILIIENLTNLTPLINAKFDLIALPLKIDADGAPARVIAQVY